MNLSNKAEFKTTSTKVVSRSSASCLISSRWSLDEDLGLTTKFLLSVILADVGSNYVPGTLTRAYFLLLEEKVLL